MLKKRDLWTLLDAAPPLGVSIFLPTHVRGAETRQDPIRLKTLLAEARGKLAEAGLARGEADDLLAPAAALVEDHAFWQHQDQGLALFLGAGALRRHRLPLAPPELVVVGPGFHIRPLLPALAPDDAFLLLTITADRVRLFEATRHGLREDPEAGLPGSLAEVTGEDADYENPQQASPANRPQVGASAITQAQVQGDSPEEWRKRRMAEFIRRIAAAVDARALADQRPVVVAADAQAQGHFRRVSKLGPQLAGVAAAAILRY
jgi:Bacterial archaeo-eukaryotic release factor family 3